MQIAPRLYIHQDSKLTAYTPGGRAARGFWSPDVTVISRRDCAFRRLKLPDASAQGFAALRLQALNEARRGHDAVYIRPGQAGRWANIWTYKTPQALRGKAVPETELQAPGPDGLRLVKGISGVEGQYWRADSLLASRWWPAAPKPHQWASFLQGLDQAALEIDAAELPATLPALSQPELSGAIPIVTAESFKTGALSPKALLKPSRLAMGIAAISLLSVSYLSAQFIHAKLSLSQTQSQLDAVSGRTGVIMQDRQAALENLASLRDFDVLEPRILLLSAWDQLASALEGQPVKFQSFNYLNGEIEIKIKGSFTLSAADIVTKIENLPAFEGVTFTLEPNQQSIVKAKLITTANTRAETKS